MRTLPWTVCVLLLASTRIAGASPGFPASIAQHLGGPIPPCTVCHDGTPQIGTATAPFAVAMRRRGLVVGDVGSLNNALDALKGEQTDTDGDGTIDTDELRKGWDPNVPTDPNTGTSIEGAARPQTLQATYGCTVRGALAQGRDNALPTALLLGLAAMLVRRRKQR